jgi:hypothetical protein
MLRILRLYLSRQLIAQATGNALSQINFKRNPIARENQFSLCFGCFYNGAFLLFFFLFSLSSILFILESRAGIRLLGTLIATVSSPYFLGFTNPSRLPPDLPFIPVIGFILCCVVEIGRFSPAYTAFYLFLMKVSTILIQSS